MINKIYIVRYSTGTWDSYQVHIEKVFGIRENAEQFIVQQKLMVEDKLRDGLERFGMTDKTEEEMMWLIHDLAEDRRMEFHDFEDDYINRKYFVIFEMEIEDWIETMNNNKDA